MHHTHTSKIAVKKLDRYRDGLRQQVRRSARDRLLLLVFHALGLLIVLVLGLAWITYGGLVAAIVIGLLSWGPYRRRVTAHELLQRRLTWLDALLRTLHDDLAPSEKLRVRYDLQPSDSWLHKVKTTKSSAGNPKAYYRSRWLRVRGMLADGTRFRIRVQSAAKSKKGRIIREQSALILEVTPPAHRLARTDSPAPHGPAETRPWATGRLTIDPARGRLVFRFQASDSELIDQLYRALRYAVALVPGQPDGIPAPGSPA